MSSNCCSDSLLNNPQLAPVSEFSSEPTVQLCECCSQPKAGKYMSTPARHAEPINVAAGGGGGGGGGAKENMLPNIFHASCTPIVDDAELISRFLKKNSIAPTTSTDINLANNVLNHQNYFNTANEQNSSEFDKYTMQNNPGAAQVPPNFTSNLVNSSTNDDLNEPKTAAYSYLKYYFVSMLQPSDNKLAMKLFGSKKGVLKEKLRQQEVGHWIIHPCSNFRLFFFTFLPTSLIY